MKLTRDKIDLLINGTRDERVYACAKSFTLFKFYYFTKYFTYKPAPFHEDFDQDVEDLVYGRIKDVGWIIYREGSKTSHAKIALVWIICRKTLIDQLREKGEDVSEVFSPPGIDELTPAAIREAARLYLNKSRYVEVTLSPEKKAA